MKQHLPRRLPRVLTFLSALVLASLMILPAPATAQQPFSESEIRDLIEGLQNGTVRPSYVSEECRLEFQADPEGEGLREVMSTFLKVPPEIALSAFCDALVLAIKSGDLTLEGLVRIARQKNDPAMFLEVGHLMRAVFHAHRQTSTASLEGATAQ